MLHPFTVQLVCMKWVSAVWRRMSCRKFRGMPWILQAWKVVALKLF